MNLPDIKIYNVKFSEEPAPLRFFVCPVVPEKLVAFRNTSLLCGSIERLEYSAESVEPTTGGPTASELPIIAVYLKNLAETMQDKKRQLEDAQRRHGKRLEAVTGQLVKIYKIIQ